MFKHVFCLESSCAVRVSTLPLTTDEDATREAAEHCKHLYSFLGPYSNSCDEDATREAPGALLRVAAGRGADEQARRLLMYGPKKLYKCLQFVCITPWYEGRGRACTAPRDGGGAVRRAVRGGASAAAVRWGPGASSRP